MRSERDALLSLQRFVACVLPEPWDIRTALETGQVPDRPFALVEASPAVTSGAPVTQDIAIPFTVNLYLPAVATRGDATDAALDVRETMWQAVKWGPDADRPTTDRIPLFAYEPRTERHRFRVARASAGTFLVTLGADPDADPPVAGTSTTGVSFNANAATLAAAIADALDVDPGAVVGHDRGRGLWDIHYAAALAGTRPGLPTIDGTDLVGALTPAGTRFHPVATAAVLLEGAPAPWRAPSDYMAVSSFMQNTIRDPDDPTLVMVAVDLRLTFARGLPVPLDRRILQRVSATSGSA